MINKDELLYKMDTIIRYLQKHNGYNYQLYNHLCPGMGNPYSNIVEYAEDCLKLINELIDIVDNKQSFALFEDIF